MSDFCIFRGGSVKMNSNYFLNCLNAEGNSLPPHFRSVCDDETMVNLAWVHVIYSRLTVSN